MLNRTENNAGMYFEVKIIYLTLIIYLHDVELNVYWKIPLIQLTIALSENINYGRAIGK
jgi:hypothetical protein